MSQVSSQASTEMTELPLVDCPRCGDGHQLLLLTSRTKNNPGKRFVKCPRNQPWVEAAKKCAFFMWLSEYEEYVRNFGSIRRGLRSNEEDKSMVDGFNQTIVEKLDHMKLEMISLNDRIEKVARLQELQMVVNGMCILFVIISFLVMLAK